MSENEAGKSDQRINPAQIKTVLALPGPRRYEHFVKVICDWQKVWSLFKDGWALAATDDGRSVFPLWPAKEYAELCAIDEWAGYESRSFSLDDLLDDLLPKLKQDNMLPGVFYTPGDKGMTPEIDALTSDIKIELHNYL